MLIRGPGVGQYMAEQAEEAAFVCPFCGRAMEGQDELTDHFATDHDMAGFAG